MILVPFRRKASTSGRIRRLASVQVVVVEGFWTQLVSLTTKEENLTKEQRERGEVCEKPHDTEGVCTAAGTAPGLWVAERGATTKSRRSRRAQVYNGAELSDAQNDVGTYSITGAPAGGTKMTDTGKYVVVFKQVGGKWLIAHDIFNSDLPPPNQGSRIEL